MAILQFQKPDKVLMLEADNFYGKFEFKPLEPGYGITVGNALRRVLLSSLEGFAISSIRIDGVKHEFDTIPGVKEDVTNIILNLKKVDLRQVVEDHEDEKVTITVSGTEIFTAGDIGKALTSFQVLNPEQVICHLDADASFTIVLTINKGRGWVPAEEQEIADDDVNILAIDSIYTPIKNVKYTIENFRVDQRPTTTSLSSKSPLTDRYIPRMPSKRLHASSSITLHCSPTRRSLLMLPRPAKAMNSMKKCCICVNCSRPNS